MFSFLGKTARCNTLKNSKKDEIFKKRILYDFIKNRSFRKLTTASKIVQSVKLRPKHASWTLITRPYPTEQVQSTLQTEISNHFAHFQFERERL